MEKAYLAVSEDYDFPVEPRLLQDLRDFAGTTPVLDQKAQVYQEFGELVVRGPSVPDKAANTPYDGKPCHEVAISGLGPIQEHLVMATFLKVLEVQRLVK